MYVKGPKPNPPILIVFCCYYCCQIQIVHVCSDRRKKGLFRGWSRLCLHIASINAAESASVAATAAERAAGDEAVQNGAAAVHKTAASEKRLTEAAAAAEEGALGENAVTTTVTAATAGRERGDGSKRSLQEQRYRCGCRLVRNSKMHQRAGYACEIQATK